MIEKNIAKLIRSLEHKKYRQEHKLFVAEGPKVVGDLMKVMRPFKIFATKEWASEQGMRCDTCTISEAELTRISFLQHPQKVLALFPLPCGDMEEKLSPESELTLVLDGIQDPGNLGTIIRIADWFGIGTIVCGNGTADAYAPKVVQASMGSLGRVNLVCTMIEPMLDRYSSKVPIYGTLLDGEPIYGKQLLPNGFVVMGNEGNGISESVRARITDALLIPAFNKAGSAESLNVAVATAIVCSEFRRRQME